MGHDGQTIMEDTNQDELIQHRLNCKYGKIKYMLSHLVKRIYKCQHTVFVKIVTLMNLIIVGVV